MREVLLAARTQRPTARMPFVPLRAFVSSETRVKRSLNIWMCRRSYRGSLLASTRQKEVLLGALTSLWTVVTLIGLVAAGRCSTRVLQAHQREKRSPTMTVSIAEKH